MAPRGGSIAKWTDEEKVAFLTKVIFTTHPNVSLPKDFVFGDRTPSALRQTLNGMRRDFLKSPDGEGFNGTTKNFDDNEADEEDADGTPPAAKQPEKKPKTPRKRKATPGADGATPTPKKGKKAKSAKSVFNIKEDNDQPEAI